MPNPAHLLRITLPDTLPRRNVAQMSAHSQHAVWRQLPKHLDQRRILRREEISVIELTIFIAQSDKILRHHRTPSLRTREFDRNVLARRLTISAAYRRNCRTIHKLAPVHPASLCSQADYANRSSA